MSMNQKFRKRTASNLKETCKKLFLLLMVMSFQVALCYARSKKSAINSEVSSEQDMLTVQGRVFDSNEPPMALPFVTVSIKDSNMGVITDDNGYFTIEAAKGDLLVFSFIGYTTKEFKVEKAYSNLIISLEEEIGKLEGSGCDRIWRRKKA